MMGREYMGILRTTYLISNEGLVKKVFEEVKPAGHSQEILAAI
jgi:peroxiredoxin Q/BCP